MPENDEVLAAAPRAPKRRRHLGPWWMRQPAPSALVFVLTLGVPILAAFFLVLAGPLFSGPDFSVRFVLPNDFVGDFQVVIDPASDDGYDDLEDNEFVLRIPENGVCRIGSDDSWSLFDRQTAVYEDGREVVLEALESDAKVHRYRVEGPVTGIGNQRGKRRSP